MTTSGQTPTPSPTTRRRPSGGTTPAQGARGTSGWVGWVAVAGLMMIILGVFHIVQGVVALANEEYFDVGSTELALDLGYTAWGWLHLLIGAVVLAAGFMVFAGKTWARAVGVVVALVSAVQSMVFLAAHPVWSVLIIALDVVVILALTVHGSEIAAGE